MHSKRSSAAAPSRSMFRRIFRSRNWNCSFYFPSLSKRCHLRSAKTRTSTSATRTSPPKSKTTGESPGWGAAGAGTCKLGACGIGIEACRGGATAAGKLGGAGAEGMVGVTITGVGSWTACANAGDGGGGADACGGACIDGVRMILVYSPGPLGAGGALRSGTVTGPDTMFSLGATGASGNSAEGNACGVAPLDTGKSLGELSLGCALKSLVNSPAEGAAGGWMPGGEGGRAVSGAFEVSRFGACQGS